MTAITIQITIEGATTEQVAALLSSTSGVAVAAASPTVVKEDKPTRAAQASKPADKPKDEPKATETPKEEPAAETDVPSKEDVAEAAKALVGKNGREALAALLEQFGAANLSGVPEERRAEFIKTANDKIA